MNHYEILHITRDADKTSIKRAYFAEVKKHPPDSDPEGFKKIRAAYEILSDDNKRAGYDALFTEDADGIQNELLKADEFIRRSDYDGAEKLLAKLVKKYPESADAALLYAKVLLTEGRHIKAINLCVKMLEANPKENRARLLQARIEDARGWRFNAETIYEQAVEIAPDDPRTWIDYMRFLISYGERGRLPELCKKAAAVSKGILKDDYYFYLICAMENKRQNKESADTLAFLTEFESFFAADEEVPDEAFESAFNATSYLNDDILIIPVVEKILVKIEKNRRRIDDFDKRYVEIFNIIGITKLRADERIHEALKDITEYYVLGGDDREEIAAMEALLAAEYYEARKSLRILRDEYPEFYDLNKKFYIDVANDNKRESILGKYLADTKRTAPGAGAVFSDEDAEGEYEKETPFVRETKKISRNDLCPCGSGKKYKICCGRS